MSPLRTYDISSLGAALVDLFLPVSEEELAGLGLEKKSTTHVDSAVQQEILRQLGGRDVLRFTGGSGANSIRVAARLGSRTALMTVLGDDEPGHYFQSELKTLGIDVKGPLQRGAATGTCICLLTPDGERTLSTDLGASASLSGAHVSEKVIASSRWLLLEGYLLVNPGNGDEAARHALTYARLHDTRVAMGLSACSVIRHFRGALEEILRGADIVFANEDEALAFTRADSLEEALTSLGWSPTGAPRLAVVTAADDGAWVASGGETLHSPTVSAQPVDVTGAGDAFTGAFLHGITGGLDPREAARRAHLVAGSVITRWGADPGEGAFQTTLQGPQGP
jgi:sugar/nucleoside kinase (ribokinase family)